jgi:tetratricopeptide (TPR) repeat protein
MPDGDRGSAHPSPADLDRFLRGELTSRQAAPVVAHLLAGCDRCRETMAPLATVILTPQAEPPRFPAGSLAEYDFPLFRAFANARRLAAALETERTEAVRERSLVEVPPPAPLSAGQRAARDRGRCEAFLASCQSLRQSDPEGMVLLASLAVTLAERIEAPDAPGVAGLADLRARAWAELGNARRVEGDLAAAEADLGRALRSADQGTGDRALLVHLMDLSASLLVDQRRFSEAFRLLDAVERIHRAAGDLHAAGRALVSRGTAAGHALQPDEAIRLLGEALRLLDARRDPALVFMTVHNLLMFLVEVGRTGEAARLFAASRPLYAAHNGRLEQLKIRWLEARIAAGLGNDAVAERAYAEVRTGFVAAELPYDAALVSLDLAAVWLRTGRTAEIRDLVDEMVAIFRVRNIRREAVAALLVLREACERRKATAALLRSVTSELQRLEREPGRRVG